MASVLDRYIADNPEAKKLPRDELLQKLYGQDDHDEPFEAFAEDITKDEDSLLGQSALRMGNRAGVRNPENLSRESALALGGEIFGNVATDIGKSVKNVVTLPGEVAEKAYKGTPMSQEEIADRAAETAMYAVPGSVARKSGREIAKQWEFRRARIDRRLFESGGTPTAEMQGEGIFDGLFGNREATKARINRRLEESGQPPLGGPEDPLSRIVPHPTGSLSKLTSPLDRFYIKAKDDVGALNTLVKKSTGHYSGWHEKQAARSVKGKTSSKLALLAEENPYVLARLTRGNVGRFEHWIEYGAYDFATGEIIGPALKSIVEPVDKYLAPAMRYALAKRAIEKYGQKIETGFDLSKALEIVQGTESANTPAAKAIVKFQRDLVQYNANLVKFLVDSGVVGKKMAETIFEANKDYLPFYRLMDEGQLSGAASKAPGTNPLKRMTGSDLEVLDPLESIVRNTYSFIHVAERNRVAQSLWALAKQNPNAAEFVKEMPIAVRPTTVTDTEMAKYLKEHGIETENPDVFTIFRPQDFSPGGAQRPNQIVVMFDGKKKLLEVDPEIGRSFSYLEPFAAEAIQKLLAQPAKWLRAGATLKPDFPLRNFTRDQFSAMGFTEYGYVPVYDAAQGLAAIFTEDKYYLEWLRNGGANAVLNRYDKVVLDMAKQKLVGGSSAETAAKIASMPIDVLRKFSNLMEDATRVGAYRNARLAGAHPLDAAYEAREITLDFARMGQQMRQWNSMTAFMNAQMEGVDRAIRAGITHPMRFNIKMVGGITAPSIALWFINHDDPRYKNAPMWEKDIYWFIKPLPDWRDITDNDAKVWSPQQYSKIMPDVSAFGGVPSPDFLGTTKQGDAAPIRLLPSGKWQFDRSEMIKIPKPFELGVLFGSVPERLLEKFYDDNPEGLRNIEKSVERAFLPNILPTFAAPLLENASNYSNFLDRQLIPSSLMRLLEPYRYNEYTSETAKQIAKLMDKVDHGADLSQPIAVENLVRGWTGGMGMGALRGMDMLLRKFGVVSQPVGPTPTTSDHWFWGNFVSRYPGSNTEPVSIFYEKWQENEKVLNTMRQLNRRPFGKEEAELLTAQSIDTAIRGYWKTLNAYRQSLNDIMRIPVEAYGNDRQRAEVEKRDQMDKVMMRMIAVALKANQEIYESQQKKKSAPAAAPTAPRTEQTVDFRFERFKALDNETQQMMLKRMSDDDERRKYIPYARATTKNIYKYLLKDQPEPEPEVPKPAWPPPGQKGL